MTLPFRSAQGESPPLPLGRYLPVTPPGAAAAWLREQVAPGSWVLDPLGANPLPALEAARAGYRVLVACNNPVLVFLLETLAQAPGPGAIQAALAELGSARRADERLESYVRSAYQVTCPTCNRRVEAASFLWRRDELIPYAAVMHCPHCNSEGEQPLNPADAARTPQPGSDALHRARALQRVALSGAEQGAAVHEALAAYLPRALTVLFTLINKQEGMAVSPERRRILQALLLHACDRASALWPHPAGRSRPRQVSVPSQFHEYNLWLALEEAAREWGAHTSPVTLTRWPKLLEAGGIVLYSGKLRNLLPLPEALRPAAVIAALPRPNQAFWTFSALWSGWLWGSEAVAPLKGALERRRYDWQWHAGALHRVFEQLRDLLPDGAPIFALAPEMVPGFLFSIVQAAHAADVRLHGVALRADTDEAQLEFRGGGSHFGAGGSCAEACYSALRDTARARGEAVTHLPMYGAALQRLAQEGLLPVQRGEISTDSHAQVQSAMSAAFSNPALRRYAAGREGESGWWFPREAGEAQIPLADRVEMEVVRTLQKRRAVSLEELDIALCTQFTGFCTPERDLVRACLESYARSEGDLWRLQDQESSDARRADVNAARAVLLHLARRMTLRSEGDNPLLWCDENGVVRYAFHLAASAYVSRFVYNPPVESGRCVLVLPGGRAGLLDFKLRRDPRLADALTGWHILKFRYLRQLADHEHMDDALFDRLLDGDPLQREPVQQMVLF